MLKVSEPLVLPAPLVAVTVTTVVAAAVGVPEMTPVAALSTSAWKRQRLPDPKDGEEVELAAGGRPRSTSPVPRAETRARPPRAARTPEPRSAFLSYTRTALGATPLADLVPMPDWLLSESAVYMLRQG